MLRNPFVRFILSFGTCLSVGYFSSLYALPLIPSWFASLAKPWFIPAGQNFTTLLIVVYVFLGIALFFIWQSDPTNGKEKKYCISLFLLGLILNFFWVYAFFGLRSPFLGVLLGIVVFAMFMSTIFQAIRVSLGGTLFLIPILVIFFIAAYTNYVILVSNPHLPLIVV